MRDYLPQEPRAHLQLIKSRISKPIIQVLYDVYVECVQGQSKSLKGQFRHLILLKLTTCTINIAVFPNIILNYPMIKCMLMSGLVAHIS
jgi:hypothetical protein